MFFRKNEQWGTNTWIVDNPVPLTQAVALCRQQNWLETFEVSSQFTCKISF